MKKTRISKFKIVNLFGYQDVEIDFTNRYKILIGENGLGKTTVLNSLYFLLDKRFKKLNAIKFDSIELIFANKNKISFTKNDLEFYVEKPSKYQGGQFYQILKTELDKKGVELLKNTIKNKKIPEQEKRFIVVDTLKKIGININAPSRFIYENINKFISEYEAINFQKVIEQIDKNITSKILYFPTYRRIESQLDNLKNQLKSKHDYYENSLFEDENNEDENEYDEVIQFGMDDVRLKIENLTQEIRQKSLVGFSKITGDLLSQLSKEFPNYQSKNTVDKKKLSIILERVGKSISEEDKLNIISYINSGSKSNKGLLYFIDKLIDLYNEQEMLDKAIKNFAETCNSYLNLKNFRYNESSVKLDIVRENSNTIIELEQLSSGEKQIVSLFSKIYLDLNKSFIVLFDEPELSLSIDWQQKLLPDIIKSEKCSFLLSVTHSPFIYENETEDYAYGLTDYINFK
ncbi:AAA family ATPase [Cellulophaga sp. HaHa_2_1]|uniref:AAA family ATPase n=1 Tax=Cellulophaga sp. HaHa_2_1 TaxID=2749994 RepID=UPI001C4E30B1|nr:AAA family ATPase [Cellulophaga sp. HaHa_2_1]QXP54139.1 AAA family ATPase [Cellulophaga sp. HaHa_2_1]